MFELKYKLNGQKVLVFVRRHRMPNERGLWVEIGHEREKDINYFINANRTLGLQVEKDERGFYRALILAD